MNINAALRRLLPAGMRDLSASGCLIEIQSPVPVGSIGLLEVDIEGVRYADWFRVARVALPACAGEPHLMGVEFLQLALAGEQSLRGAMRSRHVGRAPRINLVAPGKLSGNIGTSTSRISSLASGSAHSSRDSASKTGDLAGPEMVTKVATRLLKGRWRARLVSATHKQQQEKSK